MSTVAATDLRLSERAPASLRPAASEKLLPVEVLQRMLNDETPIRIWREYRGLSLADVSAQTGLAADQLRALEDGTREAAPDTLDRLAEILRVPAEELLA